MVWGGELAGYENDYAIGKHLNSLLSPRHTCEFYLFSMIFSGRYQAAGQMSEEGIEEWEVGQEDVSSIGVEFQRRFERLSPFLLEQTQKEANTSGVPSITQKEFGNLEQFNVHNKGCQT